MMKSYRFLTQRLHLHIVYTHTVSDCCHQSIIYLYQVKDRRE